jgi:hypothetical protein
LWPRIAEPSLRARPDAAHAGASCLSDRGGCTDQAALPACPEELEATWPKPTWWKTPAGPAAPEPGTVVVVQGELHRYNHVCTAVACAGPGKACCNQCAGGIALRASGYFITLRVRGRDLGCAGDESMLCCDVETHDQTVEVRGTVLSANGDNKTALIDNAELCQLGGR